MLAAFLISIRCRVSISVCHNFHIFPLTYSIKNQYGAFTIEFPSGTNNGLLSIHPEMAPADIGIKPTKRYFIYCVHPERGSCSFVLAWDENHQWYSQRHPAFIDPELIAWIGKQIEHRFGLEQ